MTIFLSDLYKVKKRYQRSIQISQDWKNGNGLEGYLLTPTAQQVAEQILLGIKSSDYPTAWTITGPFGTGKSAFALFLTDLLGSFEPKHDDAKKIRQSLEITQNPFIPILLQGQRSPLDVDFLNALGHSFESISPEFYKEILELQKDDRNHRAIVRLFEKATSEAKRLSFGGILVVVDEFGKYLEYAADNPEEVDLLLMQDLAETSARSDHPFILITILHSAFSDYLSHIDDTRKAEWQKVQGRFADISFIEPGEQFLKLIGAAIQADQQNTAVKNLKREVGQILASRGFDEAKKRMPLDNLLLDCSPLHPSTALLLWPLFRSALSQNERSLFSFLNDYSPYGFQEYLARTEVGKTFYHISELYDYITFTLGDSVLLSLQARRWAEIANAINRVEADAPQLAIKLIKVIGLVSLFGDQVGLKATLELAYSIFNEHKTVDEAVRYLEKKSIIVFRKFEGAFGIWEGSDVDLDAVFANAQSRIHHGDFAQRLSKVVKIQPIVARAHYIKTGTMRYFDVVIIDGNKQQLENALEQDLKPADGRVHFVLSSNISEREILIQQAIELTSSVNDKNRLKIFTFPNSMKGLEESISQVERWVWVKENTPELAGDRVARQEVQVQIRNATKKLLDIAGETLGLNGYLFTPSDSVWIQDGNLVEHKSSIDFQKWLSSLCAETFSEAPNLFNEIINRESVSSSAAAIRRNLIQKMIEEDGNEDLGFDGTPPEYSMYRSLLDESGFYRKRSSGEYTFGIPTKEWRPLWFAMQIFLDSTTSGRRPLRDLYEILKSPPYGLREGPIPIFICALLQANKDRVALYEDGRFVPEIRIETLEILIKAPETFEIQLYKLEGETKRAFEAVGEVLEQLDLVIFGSLGKGDLLDVIKPLVVFAAKLPDYTKKTKSLNPIYAVEVRDALLKARDPYELLFQTLPKIFDISITSPKNARLFAERLKRSLVALKQAYPSLLDRIENNFREAFGEGDKITSIDLRDAIIQRASPLTGYTSDPTLRLFIRDTAQINNRDWREVLARAVNQGFPTDKWLDHSLVDFQLRLMQLASDFVRLESLVREKERVDDSKIVLRVSVLDGVETDRSKIISINSTDEKSTLKLAEKIEKELEDSNENTEIKLAAMGKILDKLLNFNGGE